jgi:hypothetical protein
LFKAGRKGIINFIEVIIVIGVLFVAFAVFFPGFSFRNRWSDASMILTSRDLILTMERLNIIYQNSFDAVALQDFIDASIQVNRSSLIAWAEIEGTVKNSIVVACNCSDNQIQNLAYWMSGMKINGRNVNIFFTKSTLENIIPSDVLLIWGNTNLDVLPVNASLYNYLKTGGGIVEINDFTNYNQTPAGGVQQLIFGMNYDGGKTFNDRTYADYFSRKPNNSTDILYVPYKYFFHIPAPLKIYEFINSSTIPVENGLTRSCNTMLGHGNFTFNDTGYGFWICNSTTVYFDTDNNASADTAVKAGEKFKISGYNFTLQYIDIFAQIGVSFGSNYQFQDFLIVWPSLQGCPSGNGWSQYYTNQLMTVDDNPDRIILSASFLSGQFIDLPVVITNNTGGRTAWIADFTNDPDFKNNCLSFSTVGDDKKLLLASLLLWTSNKELFSTSLITIKNGFLTKYVNVQNSDTYEVYEFSLGLGSPFGS